MSVMGVALWPRTCEAQPDQQAAQRAKDALIVRTLERLPATVLESRPEAKAALLRHLETIRLTEKYFSLIEKFHLTELADDLLQVVVKQEDPQVAVRAAALLIRLGQLPKLGQALAGGKPEEVERLVHVLGLLADARTNALLLPLIEETNVPRSVRTAAVLAVGRNGPGQQRLLEWVEQGKLAEELRFAAASVLLSANDAMVRERAGKYLTLPPAAGGKPLPPIAELVMRRGDPARGEKIFAGTGTCAKCHRVRGAGKDVGPDLSEIGSKLSREALYLAILDPSAGISFNYETYLARLEDGTVLSGILVSQTEEWVELKTAEAVVHRLPRPQIEALARQPVSLMPADLQKLLEVDDLVDLVEYLTTLRRPEGG
jgi:putative heme-binding domain-containing protein